MGAAEARAVPARAQEEAVCTTRVVHLRAVRLPSVLVDAEGPGWALELLILSPTSNFAVRVTVDERIVFDDPYSWFESVSPLLESVDALSLDGAYALRLAGIAFRERLTVEAYPVAAPQAVSLAEVVCLLRLRR